MREVFFKADKTRGEIIRAIKAGEILVNGKNIKPSYILKENDAIEINISEKLKVLSPDKNIKLEIIFQNENFIAINKPAGLQVHPSIKHETNTLVNGLLAKFPEIATVGDEPENRPGIVHRLDKDTSGIMLIAKNQKTFLALKNKFKNREIAKTYWTIVYGKLENKQGIIDAPLARSLNYKKQTVAQAKTKTKIRPAVTEYKVLKEIGKYSLVEVLPKTGRMHQIRVHLTFLGHPIIGDKKYFLKNINLNSAIERHLLHAKKITFEFEGKKYAFESKLPSDFQTFLTKER